MRTIVTSFALLAIVAAPALSFARGDKAGNSGKTLICFKDAEVLKAIRDPKLKDSPNFGLIRDQDISQIASIETLDLYEAKLRDLRYPSFGKIFELRTGESEWDWVNRVRARFEKEFPFIREVIPQPDAVFDQFLVDAKSVAPVDDAALAWVYEPSQCTTVTTALQKKIGTLGRVQIDSRLYDHRLMSPLSRAVLMLHELVYYNQLHRFGLPKPPEEENSAPTRALIRFLIQEDLSATPTVGKLMDRLGQLGWEMKYKDVHPYLGKPFHEVKEHFLKWVKTELYKDYRVKPEYVSPLQAFEDELAQKIQRIERRPLDLWYRTFKSAAEVKPRLQRILSSKQFYGPGECIAWKTDDGCAITTNKSYPLSQASLAVVKEMLKKASDLEERQASKYAEIKAHFATRVEAEVKKFVSLEKLMEAGHRKSIAQAMYDAILKFNVDTWTYTFFFHEELPADLEVDLDNPVQSFWEHLAHQNYERHHKALYELLRSQKFERKVVE